MARIGNAPFLSGLLLLLSADRTPRLPITLP
jgi:hypothetical protein